MRGYLDRQDPEYFLEQSRNNSLYVYGRSYSTLTWVL
jgi:hypothetical protein